MPVRLTSAAVCIVLELVAPLFAAGERITDDELTDAVVAYQQPAAEVPHSPREIPVNETVNRYGLADAVVDAPWQIPQQAPTLMQCASGECQPCCRSGGLVGGVGVYVLKPHWTTNPAFATSTSAGGVTIDSQTDFAYPYSASPLIWLGYVGENGLGIRTRFWLFDQSSTTTFTNDGTATFISAAPLNYLNSSSTTGDVLTFTSGLDLDVIDFEITQTFATCGFSGQLSAGGRYTRIEQTYTHVEAPLTALNDGVDSIHDFDGFGPSIGAEVRRQLMDSGISLYANGRGAILFGKSSQQATNFNNNVVTNFGVYENWDVVPSLETELGILWEQNSSRGRLFMDAGVVGMAFFGAGNAANNQLLINSTDDQADKNATLGFFGFKLAAGMSY